MSLLLEALKKTEQSKQENNAPQPKLAGEAETASAEAEPVPPEISRPEPPAAPQDVIRRESGVPSLSDAAGGTAKTRNDAKKFLAAKQVKPQRKLTLLGALLVVITVAGTVAAYFFRPAALQSAAVSASGMSHSAMPPSAALPPPQAQTAQSFEPDLATPPQMDPKPIIAEAVQAGAGGKPPNSRNPAALGNSVEKRTLPAKPDKALAPLPMGEMDAASAISNSPDSGIKIYRDTGKAELEPLLSRAYKAYMAGHIDKAKTDYLKALQHAPNNRDALLGLAAIAANRGQTQKAIAQYQRVLHLYPRDVAALTGLIVLGGDSAPAANESSLKTLLAQNPDIGFVHFALGNLYAQQSRWPEAQEAYYNAFHATPGNADYVFNLAVSLDHLDQPKPALAYYQRALALVAGQRGGFDSEQLKKRIEELQLREKLGEGKESG